MQPESNAGGGAIAKLSATVVPSSPWRVTSVEALAGFRLRVAFAGGLWVAVAPER
jgi:hypothetical protein